jgi:hypothetical protein
MRIGTLVQGSQISADPCESGSVTLAIRLVLLFFLLLRNYKAQLILWELLKPVKMYGCKV